MGETAIADPVLAYLIDAAEVDKGKGSGGIRSTKRISDDLRAPQSAVMRCLRALEAAGSVKSIEIKGSVAGPTVIWRVADTGHSADQGDAAL